MNPVQISAPVRSWPGIDETVQDAMRGACTSPDAITFQSEVEQMLHAVRGKPCKLGFPIVVASSVARQLSCFARAYHRAMETIVSVWPNDERVRRVLWTPSWFPPGVTRDTSAANGRIHLCRLDLHLDESGGFRVLETNANCPGALISAGIAAAQWRGFLSRGDLQIPCALDNENADWTARWFIENATIETGSPPELVALIRESGGNRLELPGMAAEFERVGVEAMEIDPRDIRMSVLGVPSYHTRTFRHGYLKLGMKAFARMRVDIDAFIAAVRTRTLFVQNGLHGRLVGDNKLCLAILSDPRFEYLFDQPTVEAIKEHIPWSRGIAHCRATLLRDIKRNRSAYVLKHPFDTRGRGVVIGRDTRSDSEWGRSVDAAIRGKWLVQRFTETTELETNSVNDRPDRHDLCLGLINGRLAAAFVRSGGDLRLNLARSGRLHPVFMAP